MIDGRGHLLIPGFVNAHYHSYDVLAKGMVEDMPFDLWALLSQPGECGRGVRVVIVEGRVVLRDGRATGVDEDALAAELEDTMRRYRAEFGALHDRHSPAFPHLIDANRRLAGLDLGMDRFVGRAAARVRQPAPQQEQTQ